MGSQPVTLLDTCAWLWLIEDPSKFSPKAMRRLRADPNLYVSAISFWEVALLVTRKRVELEYPLDEWVRRAIEGDLVQVVSLTSKAALAAGGSGMDWEHRDPADRLIVATAREHNCPLITSDRAMRAFDGVNTIW